MTISPVPSRQVSQTKIEDNSDSESNVTLTRSTTPWTGDAAFAFTSHQLSQLNKRLALLPPKEILKWALNTFNNLYQTTSFGLTGCVIVDMLAKVNKENDYTSLFLETNNSQTSAIGNEDAEKVKSSPFWQHRHAGRGTSPVPIIFIDTLYHFPETTQLAQDVSSLYNTALFTFTPMDSKNRQEFEALHGEKLWETDHEAYDFLVKSEPGRRANEELGVLAVLTGRRRSQRGERGNLQVVEVDSHGVVKINPLAYWSFEETWKYVQENDVPYNPLIDRGYKSIGDIHSTQPVKEGEGERDGRWKGQAKTECGLHKDYFTMESKFKRRQIQA